MTRVHNPLRRLHRLDEPRHRAAALAVESLAELNAMYIDAVNCVLGEGREDLVEELSEQYLHDVVEMLVSAR
jgi:hypothetical protein